MTSEKSRESVYEMFRITHVVYLELCNLFRIANYYFSLLLKYLLIGISEENFHALKINSKFI